MRSIVALISSALLLGCASEGPQPSVVGATDAESTVRFRTQEGSADLRVALATTAAERQAGLQGVEALPEDRGMAFVYDEPTTTTFWMKDTLIPLSIAFVGQDGRVVAIRDMEPCRSDPCPRYGADASFVLAIEANLGWFDHAGVEVGSRAVLEDATDG